MWVTLKKNKNLNMEPENAFQYNAIIVIQIIIRLYVCAIHF